MKYILLVTIYNSRIEQSTTIMSFIKHCSQYYVDTLLYIWDNSTNEIDQNLDVIPLTVNYKYHKSSYNTPLSKVYNTVLKSHTSFSFLLNFDQDSLITPDYFIEIEDFISKKGEAKIAIPQIWHNSICISPGKKGFWKNHYLKKIDIGIVETNKMLFITSGVIIDISAIVTNCIFYDENLSLYGVDLKFSIDYSRCFSHIYVLNYKLQHDLSAYDTTESKCVKLHRLKNNLHSDIYICSREKFSIIREVYIRLRYLYHYLIITFRYNN